MDGGSRAALVKLRNDRRQVKGERRKSRLRISPLVLLLHLPEPLIDESLQFG
jgi:hypothetical protein